MDFSFVRSKVEGPTSSVGPWTVQFWGRDGTGLAVAAGAAWFHSGGVWGPARLSPHHTAFPEGWGPRIVHTSPHTHVCSRGAEVLSWGPGGTRALSAPSRSPHSMDPQGKRSGPALSLRSNFKVEGDRLSGVVRKQVVPRPRPKNSKRQPKKFISICSIVSRKGEHRAEQPFRRSLYAGSRALLKTEALTKVRPAFSLRFRTWVQIHL